MSSGNMELLESMSESQFGEYRIHDGKVEARNPAGRSNRKTDWREVSPEQLSRHVRDNTVVARWLETNLGWRRLLRACVGLEPDVCGGSDHQAAYTPEKRQTVN